MAMVLSLLTIGSLVWLGPGVWERSHQEKQE